MYIHTLIRIYTHFHTETDPDDDLVSVCADDRALRLQVQRLDLHALQTLQIVESSSGTIMGVGGGGGGGEIGGDPVLSAQNHEFKNVLANLQQVCSEV